MQEQKKAARQGAANAQAQAKAADEATNRANRKTANVGAAMDAALLSGRAGAGGTMLTGAQGVPADQLNLGRNTLLGA